MSRTYYRSQSKVFPNCDYDNVCVTVDRNRDILVKFQRAGLESLGGIGSSEIQPGIKASVEQNLDAVDVKPVGALYSNM